MSTKWIWIVSIATLAGLALTIVFFAVTQNITLRDLSALGIGIVLGAVLAWSIAVGIFFSDGRTRRIAGAKAEQSKRLKLIDALPTRTEEIDRLVQRVTGFDEGIARADAYAASHKAKADEARGHGFMDDYEYALGESRAAEHTATGLRTQRESAVAGLARLRELPDREYLAEQKRARGLD